MFEKVLTHHRDWDIIPPGDVGAPGGLVFAGVIGGYFVEFPPTPWDENKRPAMREAAAAAAAAEVEVVQCKTSKARDLAKHGKMQCGITGFRVEALGYEEQ